MEKQQKWTFGTWIQSKFHSVLGISLMALLFGSVFLSRDATYKGQDLKTKNKSLARCDLLSGKWVYDPKSFPLYREDECSFMIDDYSCQKYGRKDSKYQHWRWQPHDCDLPRFNGTTLLENLRGKRIIFVGDSVNKNQWISLLCLLETSIPPSERLKQWHGSLMTFRSSVYDVSIDFYWEPMLVESNCDDPIDHHVMERVIKVQRIESHAIHWKDADMLIFNSFMWWLSPNTTVLWGSYEDSLDIYKEVGRARRYEMAVKTWTDWLNLHINRTKTELFFMSLSPYHQEGKDWGKGADTNCYNETEPILDEGFWGSGSERPMMEVAENAVQQLKNNGIKVQYVNITELSDKRREGHPSIYRKHWKPPNQEELANPTRYSDCVHWCLPGVPDVWNHLLYAYILHYF
ncbi:protein trichome birefringence-like 34 [Heracleum sosnowskyi]|uniref:Protein trichome birefringence-like 34 n=1 Tax=Heracleum sosnowskyi TaxID=360622 RepID=A0AAD8J8M3_9APIA|nr:protein trichome birefringence-like 34 [Heracleum sosnowskyi]